MWISCLDISKTSQYLLYWYVKIKHDCSWKRFLPKHCDNSIWSKIRSTIHDEFFLVRPNVSQTNIFFAKMQLLNLLLKYHFQEIFVDSLLYINFVFLCNVVLHIVVPKFTCNLVYIFKRRPYRANNYILCFIEKWWQN